MLLIDLFDITDKNEGIVENLIEDGSIVVSSSLIGMRFGKDDGDKLRLHNKLKNLKSRFRKNKVEQYIIDEFKKHNCLYMLEKDKKDW